MASSWTQAAEPTDSALTGYVGRITTVNAWHDIVTQPNELEFADAYLAALALSYTLARYREDALSLETEGQVVYNFGDQSHWEFNGLLASRWHRLMMGTISFENRSGLEACVRIVLHPSDRVTDRARIAQRA